MRGDRRRPVARSPRPADRRRERAYTPAVRWLDGTSPTSGKPSPSRSPTRPAQIHGDRPVTWPSSTAGPTALAAALLDGRLQRAGQGGALPLQRPRVPRGAASPRSRRGWSPVNTNYRYADDELSTSGTTPTRWPSCSTAPSPTASRASVTACPACARWLWVDDGEPCPRGPRRTRTSPRHADAGRRRLGPQRRRPVDLSTPAARPACPRA